jgi:hypothetical protein
MSVDRPAEEYTLILFRETDKGILVGQDDSVQVWLPKSQVEIMRLHHDKPGQAHSIIDVLIPDWLAMKKGLS